VFFGVVFFFFNYFHDQGSAWVALGCRMQTARRWVRELGQQGLKMQIWESAVTWHL